ncbi:Nitrate reductase [NADH] 1, partial [Stylosanthes scabra]|nr:Nitrate reductase [NADH] 1 [Stylosanthes scabra]
AQLAKSTWIIVHDHVYDYICFLKHHPCDTDIILINADTDCTEEFDAIHSDKAKNKLEDYRIGELSNTGYTSSSVDSSPNTTIHGKSATTHLSLIKDSSYTSPKHGTEPTRENPIKASVEEIHFSRC